MDAWLSVSIDPRDVIMRRCPSDCATSRSARALSIAWGQGFWSGFDEDLRHERSGYCICEVMVFE